jgi:lipid A oxidase
VAHTGILNTGILNIGWGRAADRRPRGSKAVDALIAGAASIALIASAGASIMEQASLDNGAAGTSGSASGSGATTLPVNETVVGAYTGVPYTYPSQVRIGKDGGTTNFTIDPVHWFTDPFHNPIYYGARVQRWFAGGGTGVMVDFIHSKAMARRDDEADFSGQIEGKPVPAHGPLTDVVKKLEFSHGHNMLLFNGLLRLPSIGTRLSPYVGAGGGVLLPHAEATIIGSTRPRTYEYNYAGPAAQAIAGLEFRLPRLSFFVEYKFTYADYEAPLSEQEGSWLFLDLWRQFNRWLNGEEPPGGHVATQVVSHQVVGGLAVRFTAR